MNLIKSMFCNHSFETIKSVNKADGVHVTRNLKCNKCGHEKTEITFVRGLCR
jgi:hypothetical protein